MTEEWVRGWCCSRRDTRGERGYDGDEGAGMTEGGGAAALRRRAGAPRPRSVEDDDAAAVFALFEVVEGLVDFVERVAALDDVVDFDTAGDVHVDERLEGAMGAGGAVVAADQRLLLAHHVHQIDRAAVFHRRDPHYDGRAALAGGVERLVGGFGGAEGVEGEIDAAVGELAHCRRGVHVARVDGVGCAEAAGELQLVVVDVDGDDPRGVEHPRALDGVEADAAGADHGDGHAGVGGRLVDHRADAGGDGAADQGGDLHRHLIGDGEAGLLGGDDVFAEDAELAHLEDLAAVLVVQADGAVEQPRAGGLVCVAELRLPLAAGGALPAGGDEREDAAVAGLEFADAGADGFDGARAFVSEHGGQGEGGGTLDDVVVGGADAGGAHADADFAVLRLVLDEVFDFERGVGCVEDGCAHGGAPFPGQFASPRW